ncbi:hypothetical protein DRQ53_13450, partial [bacterium]
GSRVAVVDPAGAPEAAAVLAPAAAPLVIEAPAQPGLAGRLGQFELVVVSLSARGQGRAAGALRPSGVAGEALPPRIAALELALATLVEGGTLIELAGAAVLKPAADEAGLIGGWQEGIHRGLAALASIRAFLCAIATPVRSRRLAGEGETWPTAQDIGTRLLELHASDHDGGLFVIAAPDFRPVRQR